MTQKLDLSLVKKEIIKQLSQLAYRINALRIVEAGLYQFISKKITRRETNKINKDMGMNKIHVYPDFNSISYYIRFYRTDENNNRIAGTEDSVYMGSQYNNPDKVFTKDLYNDLCNSIRGLEELYEKMDEVNINVELLVNTYNNFIDVFDGFKSMRQETGMYVFPDIFKLNFLCN